VSEFIAILTILVVAVVGVMLAYSFVGGLISTSRANIKYLDASVSNIETLYRGGTIQVDVGGSTFTASYIYRVTVTLHNVGAQKIINLSFQTISVNNNIRICASDLCDIYDPVTFARRYTDLPTELNPNQIVQVNFVILSKVDLLNAGTVPFLIKVQGYAPDGSPLAVYVGLKEG